MKTYRVAILGCRGRGTAAARAYHAHPRTEVVALCDLMKERRDTLGDELGVTARYDDLDKMITTERPDIVAIPTGTEFHYPLAMRVLAHGVNIDVEKPLCTSLDEADDVLALAAKKNVRVAVHHQGRTGPAVQAAARALAEGKIGTLRYLRGSGKGYYGGYGVMNIATHTVNMMLRFGGHVQSVSATAITGGHLITPEDVIPAAGGMGIVAGENITATLHFANGLTASLLEHRFPVYDSNGVMLELHGTDGRIAIRGDRVWILPQPHFIPDGSFDQWEPLPLVMPDHYDRTSRATTADYLYTDDYVQALDTGRDHECSGAEGRHVMEVLMGIFEAAAYRKHIDLPQADRKHPLVRWRQEHGLGDPAPMPRPYAEWLAAEDRRLGR